MRKFSIVTTFNDSGYELYGKNMLESFAKHWDKDVDLYAYYEGTEPSAIAPNIKMVDLNSACPDLAAFKKKYGDDPVANGRVGVSQYGIQRPATCRWAHKEKTSFLYDAVRFSHKVYAIIHAARNVDTDVLLWVDADILTYRDVPLQFISDYTPEYVYTCYLKRHNYYPECGFVSYNTKHAGHKKFIDEWEYLYNSGELFEMTEWHDSYVYGEILRELEDEGVVTSHSYSGDWERSKHPFGNCPLGDYMDHLKGNRKFKGKSLRKDMHNKSRLDDYWKDAPE